MGLVLPPRETGARYYGGDVLEMSLRGLGGGGRIAQMGMRTTICLSVIIVLATIPLPAQNVSSRRLSRAVVDPVELSGPPKAPITLSPAKRAFAQSAAMNHLESKDPSVLAATLREITSFIQQDPTDPDFFFMRATVSCEIAGSNKETILRDIDTSLKLWKPNENSAIRLFDGPLCGESGGRICTRAICRCANW